MTQHTAAISQCWLTYDTNVVDDTGAVKGLNKECQEAALVFVCFPRSPAFFSLPSSSFSSCQLVTAGGCEPS